MQMKALLLALMALSITACSSNQLKEPTTEEKKAEAYYTRGTTELVNKNYVQALTFLLQAKELNSKDSKIRNNLGMAYFFREQISLAESELREAISLDEKNTDARLNLGSLYMSQNKIKEAREQFLKAEQDLTFSNQYRNFYNLAVLSLKEGDRRSAYEYLAKSIKEREDYCLSHFKLGELQAEEYRFKEALKSFQEAGKGTCVTEPAPLYQQAMALLNLNRNFEAKRKFQEVVDKFSSTKFGAMASVQLKKINNTDSQPTTRATQTEIIRSSDESVETPNF